MSVTLAAAPTDEIAACFHCGESVADSTAFTVAFDGKMHPVCCAGCQAVAETILSAGLADFYRTRTALPGTRDSAVPRAAAAFAQYELPGIRDRYQAPDQFDRAKAHAVLLLDGITCPACVWLAERRLRQLPGVARVNVNFATERAEVVWDPDRVGLADIVSCIDKIGLSAYPAETDVARLAQEKAQKRSLWELFVAAFAMMQVMMYTVPMYMADPGEVTEDLRGLMQWAGFVLTIPVMLFSARPLFRSAARALASREVNMDVPVSLAIALTFAASAWSMLTAGGETYFDSISMFVFLLLGARWLEARLRRKGVADLERLARATPSIAWRLPHYPQDTNAIQVASAALVPGDMIRVDTGASLPADGIVVGNGGEVDEALMTGESRPVAKAVRASVIGGSINLGRPLFVQVVSVGPETVLSRIVRDSEQALGERPAIGRMADRVAARMALATLVIAAVTAVAWLLIDSTRALAVTVSVLAITCPCALALAVPATLTAATGRIVRAGIIVRRSRALEALASATDIVLDKTGTLTTGLLRVDRVEAAFPGAALAIAAALESGSPHPVARAITAAAKARDIEPVAAEEIELDARGISGLVGGIAYRLGADESEEELAAGNDDPQTRVVLRRGASHVATFVLRDRIRDDAQTFVRRVQQAGLRVHMLSGDAESAVKTCANALGITHWRARLTPDEKRACIASLQRNGAVVIAMGDGVNDAPALSQADCGIAIASGADLARARADAVLIDQHLSPVADALEAARRARTIIKQNLVWAALYNAIAIPAAASGLVAPWLAALGMSASSLAVIANAARAMKATRAAGPR